ncbi:hypothetical protein BIW11_09896 [Tropilaelaps mercedesae]|uniref:E2 ubiquitin-conjugating enzyme n=1 Tax=Tropilaelaps mercedesae TaxID=418985 RepID=A0A1V9XI60_9ACAR|nr:hypothetical protein BIW11_09896 [Tropilaelaps mercedesae]
MTNRDEVEHVFPQESPPERFTQIGGASGAVPAGGDEEGARMGQIQAPNPNSPHSRRRRLLQRLFRVKNVHKLFQTSRRRSSRSHNSRQSSDVAPTATTPRRNTNNECNEQAKVDADTHPLPTDDHVVGDTNAAVPAASVKSDEDHDEDRDGEASITERRHQLTRRSAQDMTLSQAVLDEAGRPVSVEPREEERIDDDPGSGDVLNQTPETARGNCLAGVQQAGGSGPGGTGLLSLAARSRVQPTSTAKTRRAFQETIKRNEEVRTKRLMKELRDVQKIIASQKYPAFTVELIDSNLFEWCVRLHQVDPESALARDMLELGVPCVELCFEFPDNFPFLPPFVRVLSPHIEKGFVMEGGAICLELLTPAGWASAYTVEAIIVQVTAALSKGQARINVQPKASKHFSRKLAEMSFKSLVKTHNKYGWVTPPKSDG